jgi:cytochrome c oxidase assembly factor CtaG
VWSKLVVGLVGMVLLLVLLVQAERALIVRTRRRLDRSRRALRSFVFLVGVAAWAYASYAPLYLSGRQWWWFASFLVVAGVWKLVVDILIFGVPDRPDSAKPMS